jgi:predicted RecA/RadA family phage recombinase
METKAEWIAGNILDIKTGAVADVTMTKGTILDYTGANKGSAATRHSIGVLSHDVAVGDYTYTFPEGSIVLVQAADDSIAVGDQLIPDDTETGKATTGAVGDSSFGIALDESNTADDWIRVKLQKDIVPA